MKIHYKYPKADNLLILGTMAKLMYEENPILDESETMILHAIKRSSPTYAELSNSEIGERLSGLDENQLLGLANNIKGIYHELQFIEIENSDGDSITASLYPETNHKGFDVMLTDEITGEVIDVQLKATDSTSYVQAWHDEYQDGEILVTEEIAEKMNLKTSGISNDEITVEVDDFMDKLIESSETDEFWEYIPHLSAISIAIAGSQLFYRYKKGEIDFSTFKSKFIKLTGIKISKFALISGALMIPGVNIVVGAGLLFATLTASGNLAKRVLG